MSDTLTSPTLTDDEVSTLKEVAANYKAAVSGEHTPGAIPTTDTRPPPSVWSAGDVHHTHEQIYDESPAGVQAANAPDPRDAEILRLNAIIAGTSNDPKYVPDAVDPKDAELARLRAQVAGATEPGSVDATATTVDPRDAEIEQLKADLAARDAEKAPEKPPLDVPNAAPAGDAPAPA